MASLKLQTFHTENAWIGFSAGSRAVDATGHVKPDHMFDDVLGVHAFELGENYRNFLAAVVIFECLKNNALLFHGILLKYFHHSVSQPYGQPLQCRSYDNNGAYTNCHNNHQYNCHSRYDNSGNLVCVHTLLLSLPFISSTSFYRQFYRICTIKYIALY